MRVRVYVKRQLRLDRLTFQQRDMFKLGNIGLASRKDEISQAKNATGGPAKPLSKRYAIRKSRLSKGGQGAGRNKRDLRLTGDMLREWSVRTVSNTQAVAAWTTRRNREKARGNEQLETFISWSPKNSADVTRAADLVMKESSKRLVIERVLNG